MKFSSDVRVGALPLEFQCGCHYLSIMAPYNIHPRATFPGVLCVCRVFSSHQRKNFSIYLLIHLIVCVLPHISHCAGLCSFINWSWTQAWGSNYAEYSHSIMGGRPWYQGTKRWTRLLSRQSIVSASVCMYDMWVTEKSRLPFFLDKGCCSSMKLYVDS